MNTNTISAASHSGSSDYLARRSRHAVAFYCDAPEATNVFVTGDFNDWRADATPMQRGADGRWTAHVELLHGHHQYLFLVDGKPRLDSRANGRVRQPNPWHDAASLIAVS